MKRIQYDENILQNLANSLYRQAALIVLFTTAKYGVIGAAIGAVATIGIRIVQGGSAGLNMEGILAPPANLWIFGLGIVGILVGVAQGSQKALTLKIEAQKLLCQLQIERNTRHAS